MKRLTFSLIAVSALTLSACASLAPYGPQQAARGQGFSEQRIESNRFRVTYNGVGVGLGLDLSGPQPTSTTLEIVMGRGARPDRADAYDARGVQDAIRMRL
jgi:hypothetical protein